MRAADAAPGVKRIGVALHAGGGFSSVRQVAAQLLMAIGEQYTPVRFEPTELDLLDDGLDVRARRVVNECGALLGFGSALLPLLRAREFAGRSIPCVIFALGTMPRGAREIRVLLPYLRTTDVFVVTCEADRALVEAFLPSAQVELLPLAVDPLQYFPLSPEQRAATRAGLGATEASELILYAGRLTVEKNVHSVLRAFAAISSQLTDPYLLLAGPFEDRPFHETGVVPIDYARALARATDRLGLDGERVCHLGVLGSDDLRAAYAAADVVVNLTLHHDENFGLGPAEARACGTPVVGTAWGGLKDTLARDTASRLVDTVVTPLGVKVDWWGAANAMLAVLRERRSGVNATDGPCPRPHCTPRAFRAQLCAVIKRALDQRQTPSGAIEASSFATEFWDACTPQKLPHARYMFHDRSFALYRRLIGYYAGGAGADKSTDAWAGNRQTKEVLVLATPVTALESGQLAVADPLYPAHVPVPQAIADAVRSVVGSFERHPVQSEQRLLNGSGRAEPESTESVRDALRWLTEIGVLLRGRRDPGGLDPDAVPAALAEPVFRFRTVDEAAADFLVIRRSASPAA